MGTTIFNHELSKLKNSKELSFKSMGFNFSISISKIKLDIPFVAYSLTLTCNKVLYTSISVTEEFLIDSTSKLELILMKELFSDKSVKRIMHQLKSIEHVKPSEL